MLEKLHFKEPARISGDGLLLDFLEDTPSAKFYNRLFSDDKSFSVPELYHEIKEQAASAGDACRVMESIVADLKTRLPDDAIVVELGGGIEQHRSGNATLVFRNYVPLDISRSNITRYCETFKKTGIVADAARLPFEDSSVDCIVTHTFLEHPLNPQIVIEEIIRVLRPGGIVVHNDAWFCRWWQRYACVGLKKFRNMTFREKVIRMAAWCTELKLIRIPPILLARTWRMIAGKMDPVLHYKKLTPNYELLLGCDEDAASSLDPVEVLRFYNLHGFISAKKLDFLQLLLHQNSHIILLKN